MSRKYCVYCIKVFIIIIFIHMCCATNKLLGQQLRSTPVPAVPLSVHISNKYLSKNDDGSGPGVSGAGAKIVPIALRRGGNENIIEVLNSDQVKRFLHTLPVNILKQLNHLFSVDEYYGYCYLIQLFKYYNKSWASENIPLRNCVLKDDQIFGQYTFESQKLLNQIAVSETTNNNQQVPNPNYNNNPNTESVPATEKSERNSDDSSVSSNAYSTIHKQQTFIGPQSTSGTTPAPRPQAIIYTVPPGPVPTPAPEEVNPTANPTRKFKLYLKNNTVNFKPSPYEPGFFKPSFPPPLSSRSNSVGLQSSTNTDPASQNYKNFRSLQRNFGTQDQILWSNNPFFQAAPIANPNPYNVHPHPNIPAMQQLPMAGQDNHYSDQDKNRFFPLSGNNVQSLISNYSRIPPFSPKSYQMPGALHTPPYQNSASAHSYHAQVSIPSTPSPYGLTSYPNPVPHSSQYGTTSSHYYPNVHTSTVHHGHAHAHVQPVKSWYHDYLPTIFHTNSHHSTHSSHYGSSTSQKILELSITILPFLAFGSYIIILLLQAIYPAIRAKKNRLLGNGTNIFPIVGRALKEDLFRLPVVENEFVNELANKVSSALFPPDFGNNNRR